MDEKKHIIEKEHTILMIVFGLPLLIFAYICVVFFNLFGEK